jgi:hypothetical protein
VLLRNTPPSPRSEDHPTAVGRDRPLLAEANGRPFEFRSFKVDGVADLNSIARAIDIGSPTKVKPIGVGEYEDGLPLELTEMEFPPR